MKHFSPRSRLIALMSAVCLSATLSGCGGESGGAATATGVVVTGELGRTASLPPVAAAAPSTVDSLTLQADAAAITVTLDPSALPVRTTPAMMGVGTHFPGASSINYDPAQAAAAIGAVGLNSFRDDIYWPIFDPKGDGVTATIPSRLTSFLSQTRAAPLLILNRGNAAVPDTMPPTTDAGRAAFAAFAARAVKTIGTRGSMYEIWNEWNISASSSPGATARLASANDPNDTRAAGNYARLASVAGQAVKSADPTAKVIVGASGDDWDWSWSRSVVDNGGLAYADGFSVHLYNHCEAATARTATRLVDRMTALRQSLTASPQWRDVPIYVSEWGWPNADRECGGVADTVAGPNIAQFSLYLAGTPWVGGGWLYELKDQAANSTEREQTFGLFNYDYSEKPRTCYYREAMAVINGATAIETQRLSTDLFVAKVTTGGGVRLLAWTTAAKGLTGKVTVGGDITFSTRTLCGANPSVSGRSVTFGAAPVEIAFDRNQKVAFQVRQM